LRNFRRNSAQNAPNTNYFNVDLLQQTTRIDCQSILFQYIIINRRNKISIKNDADLIIIASLRKSARKNITSIICESRNNYLINFKNGLIIFHARRDLTYGIKKVINVDLINIKPNLISLNFKNCLSCRILTIFR
jgi:hypothetical protein